MKPTVGRSVHFYGANVAPVPGTGPFAAIVTRVNADESVDLAVLAPFASNLLIGTKVPFGDEASKGDYWCWPPCE